MAKESPTPTSADPLPGLAHASLRNWMTTTFPDGPTSAQKLAWPRVAARRHAVLISPTGTGKTLAAFLAVIDRLLTQRDRLGDVTGLRCLYVSPLKSLGYDIEQNLNVPLRAIQSDFDPTGHHAPTSAEIRVGVRTGDTPANHRRKLRENPPQILITTPESLALMLAQPSFAPMWRTVEQIIVDEIHALVPGKRGADLMLSLERLSALATQEPIRLGLSATCEPPDLVGTFLGGPTRDVEILRAAHPRGDPQPILEVESLLASDEGDYRPLALKRLTDRLIEAISEHRTTVIFANTRALAEQITHGLRAQLEDPESIATHHSALDSERRRNVELRLRKGSLRAVVTSTSLELGVDIGSADLTVLVGLPGSVSRCLQRVGRSGHRIGSQTRGLFLASNYAELAGAAVTAHQARASEIEKLRMIRAPLDVLCQQLVGMACQADEWTVDQAWDLIRQCGSFAELERSDLLACLNYLSGQLSSPAGAYETEPGAEPRWTAPRLWKLRDRFGLRNLRVQRWFLSNVGTIHSEESFRVVTTDGEDLGTVEAQYAERLQANDRFLLDGRSLTFRRLDGLRLIAEVGGKEADLPRWTSDRQSLSPPLAYRLAEFRTTAARLLDEGPSALRGWLCETYELEPDAAARLTDLFEAQGRVSEMPSPGILLIEESRDDRGWTYTFHAPLPRAACEALGRAIGSRLGETQGRDVALTVADLGFQITMPDDSPLTSQRDWSSLVAVTGLEEAVLQGLDKGELMARRFRHIAGTGMMVLRRPEDGKTRVGGTLWVSQRLFPLVQAACPDHPLLKETRREVLEDLLDLATARAWLARNPQVRFRRLDEISPLAWATLGIGPQQKDSLQFDSPDAALRRLHARLVT